MQACAFTWFGEQKLVAKCQPVERHLEKICARIETASCAQKQ
jgi:hypothetical protein